MKRFYLEWRRNNRWNNRVDLFYGILTIVLLAAACYGLSAIAGESSFNLIFKYGVAARNELNTFKGIYTKDMVVDPPITINLSLSKDELDRIYRKMAEINFFDYPDKFSPGETVIMVIPYYSYYFKVEYNSKIKEVSWDDNIIKNKKAEELRELTKFIIDLIANKEEYKKLPPPRGGYL